MTPVFKHPESYKFLVELSGKTLKKSEVPLCVFEELKKFDEEKFYFRKVHEFPSIDE